MSLLAVPIIAFIALTLVLILAVLFFVIQKKLKIALAHFNNQLQGKDILLAELQLANEQQKQLIAKSNQKFDQISLENTQVSKQLEHRIKVMQKQLTSQQELLTQLQEQQPEDKLYSRAYKLVALGADIDEIITECELPRAEAEMIMSVYQSKS